jgi:hypothetical protein
VRLWNQYKGIPDLSHPKDFYNISSKQKMIVAGSYFGLISALFGAMAINSEFKRTPEQIQFERRSRDGSIVGDGLTNFHKN